MNLLKVTIDGDIDAFKEKISYFDNTRECVDHENVNGLQRDVERLEFKFAQSKKIFDITISHAEISNTEFAQFENHFRRLENTNKTIEERAHRLINLVKRSEEKCIDGTFVNELQIRIQRIRAEMKKLREIPTSVRPHYKANHEISNLFANLMPKSEIHKIEEFWNTKLDELQQELSKLLSDNKISPLSTLEQHARLLEQAITESQLVYDSRFLDEFAGNDEMIAIKNRIHSLTID